MTRQFSPRDWEYLSAYLDRQLKPNEVTSLEARLSADPDLSAALGELQRTRDALRRLPKMRAPHNFTLTPQMVGQRSSLRSRPAGRLAPVFGFASALATFLLILVILGDVLGILAPSTKPVAQAPTRASEASLRATATLTVEEPSAPLLGLAPQATAADTVEAQIQESPRTLTETAPLSLTVGAAAPFARVEVTPTVSETETTPMTMTAKLATGIGGGGPTESENGLLPSDSIATSEGPMWVTTLLVTISPTETLTFPMTITLEGPSITETITVAAENGLPEEELTQTEPALTAVPEQPLAEVEPSVPAPTGTPETIARAVVTPIPSPSVPQTYSPNPIPSQTLVPALPAPQPTRSGKSAVRILEIMLAALALAAGLAAILSWWLKRF